MPRHYLGPFWQKQLLPEVFPPSILAIPSVIYIITLTGIVILSPKIMNMSNYIGDAICSKQTTCWPLNVPGTRR